MKKYLEKSLLAVFLPASVALMVACTDTYYADDYRNYDREFGRNLEDDGNDSIQGWETKWLGLEGKFNLTTALEPLQLDIYALDDKLERQEKVSARIVRNRLDFTYKAKEIKFEKPFVEFDFVCRLRDSKDTTEMQFTVYANLNEKKAADIDLYHALESKYLKKLVQKKGESFNMARKHAHEAIHDLLDPEQEFEYGIENAPYGNDTLETLAYHYCRFFLKDSVSYKNFKKLVDAVGGEKKWDETLSAKDVLDELVDFYKLGESHCDSAVFASLKKDPDFTQLRYDIARWVVGDTSTCETETLVPRDTGKVSDTTKADSLKGLTPDEAFGECGLNRQNQKEKLEDGKYFQCNDKKWVSINAPVYYGDKGEEGEYATYDGRYFHCRGGYSWNEVPSELLLSPVKDLRKCNIGEIVQYSNKFYRCGYVDRYGYTWYALSDDSTSAYKKNGLFCTDSTEGRIEQVNGSYWTCGQFFWKRMGFADSVLYAFNRLHKDECKNGPKGTTVHWNEAISEYYSSHTYFACDAKSLEWVRIGIMGRENYERAIFDGGVFVDDTTVKVSRDEFTITVLKRGSLAGVFDAVGAVANIGGKEYGAMFRNEVPYLSAKKGSKEIVADTFPEKSESFDSFVTRYTHPESAYPAFKVLLTRVGEESYMDWERAASFCPAGYHLPDTSEWAGDFVKKFPMEAIDAQDSPIKVRYNDKFYLYDIYWTTDSKASGTHYCYEIRYEGNEGAFGRVVECPDDLYPGVQTLCFKDGED
ncbi:MAG: hypothetical protein IK012_03645 [Fibrobacter sp.]|uniref:hypothetical protein n=1 Tax=Fibrobacter sp. TaxID=35828 RepID=UPI0025BAAF71|nr:hypothetical protein [Fibrobacter sp.]MBR4784330.1 hypothetical protein [Fibrobacter sp.]